MLGPTISITLTGPLDEIPLEERCLKTELLDTHIPKEEHSYTWIVLKRKYIADNTAIACLGNDPITVISSGEVDLFAVFDCISVAAYPCGSADTLELAAAVPRDLLLNLSAESSAVTSSMETQPIEAGPSCRGRVVLRPESFIIQVKDPGAHGRGPGDLADWKSG